MEIRKNYPPCAPLFIAYFGKHAEYIQNLLCKKRYVNITFPSSGVMISTILVRMIKSKFRIPGNNELTFRFYVMHQRANILVILKFPTSSWHLRILSLIPVIFVYKVLLIHDTLIKSDTPCISSTQDITMSIWWL